MPPQCTPPLSDDAMFHGSTVEALNSPVERHVRSIIFGSHCIQVNTLLKRFASESASILYLHKHHGFSTCDQWPRTCRRNATVYAQSLMQHSCRRLRVREAQKPSSKGDILRVAGEPPGALDRALPFGRTTHEHHPFTPPCTQIRTLDYRNEDMLMPSENRSMRSTAT